MDAAEWGQLLALSGLWGATFMFVEVALAGGLPPLTLALLRVALAAAALHLLLALAGGAWRRPPMADPRRSSWAAFAVMGTLNNVVPFGLIFWAQQHLTGGSAAILNATTPLWSVLLARFATRDEALRPNRLIGVMLGVAGVAVVVRPAGLLAGSGGGAGVVAQGAVLLAAASYAFAGIYGRRLRSLPPASAAAGQLTASALIILPAACLLERPWALPMPGRAALAAVAGLALLSTALAYVVYFRLLRSAGATNLLLVTLLIPPSALLLGAGLLGEPVEPRQLAGMALIGAGLAAIDGRPLRKFAARTSRKAARGARPGRP
jgi:drug/metabolite transporter (DMT)-like permease